MAPVSASPRPVDRHKGLLQYRYTRASASAPAWASTRLPVHLRAIWNPSRRSSDARGCGRATCSPASRARQSCRRPARQPSARQLAATASTTAAGHGCCGMKHVEARAVCGRQPCAWRPAHPEPGTWGSGAPRAPQTFASASRGAAMMEGRLPTSAATARARVDVPRQTRRTRPCRRWSGG